MRRYKVERQGSVKKVTLPTGTMTYIKDGKVMVSNDKTLRLCLKPI